MYKVKNTKLTLFITDKATQKKLATDAMFKLEHGSDDQKKGKSIVSTLSQLEDRREQYKDDYILNKIARERFRVRQMNCIIDFSSLILTVIP